MTLAVIYRPGHAADALCIGVLATHVFLDTYATKGVRPDLAREALSACSPDAFAARLADPARRFLLAESEGYLVAFTEIALNSACPVPDPSPVEVVRLYVHPGFQRRGIGAALLVRADVIAAQQEASAVWLTAWVGNARALAFYRAVGYEDIGTTSYVIEGQHYENRVLRKGLAKR